MCSAEALFSEKGANGTSVSDVASRAGCTVGAVYHHFTDPDAMRESLGRALRPNGIILVIDFEPKSRSWLKRPKSVPDSREGHGISKSLLIEEMESAGFELEKEINPWHGRDFCFLFRLASPSDVTPDL